MKISLEINLSAIDKTKIIDKSYKNKDGVTVNEKIYKLDLVELKEKKLVTAGADWIMNKTHFLVEPQTKEQREKKEKSKFLGSGFVFERKEQELQEQLEKSRTSPSEDFPQGISEDEIPF
jgi:hypothetical protein